MKRDIYQSLIAWKHSDIRKPMILRGARQVGKTYLLEHFAKEQYADVIYLNFDEMPEYISIFEENLNPKRILQELCLQFKKPIDPGATLIVFDEVQECPNALNSLKYFCEKMNQYHVAAAGSLLGVKMSKGFPVGKVNFIDLAPLSYFEFLDAVGESDLRKKLSDTTRAKPISTLFHEKLIKLLKYYFVVGGMPDAVHTFVKTKDLNVVRKSQQEILNAYALDFAKHAPPEELQKIMAVWHLIPSQLAKENKKFIFTAISKSARARNYETAIQWLVDAGLIINTYHISKPALPLMTYANRNAFKIYSLDVGLLGAMSKLAPEIVLKKNKLFTEFHGSLVENYAAQELSIKYKNDLYYWTSEGTAEIDFIVSTQQKVFPLEIKAGISKLKKSLIVYGNKYNNEKETVPILSRGTLRNFAHDGNIVNYPLYAIMLFPDLNFGA